jgi:hypothetical protein
MIGWASWLILMAKMIKLPITTDGCQSLTDTRRTDYGMPKPTEAQTEN